MANEKRLIDADDLIRDLIEEYHGMLSDEELKIYQVIRILDALPTVDAVEVVHGRWAERYPLFLECSKCGTGYVRYEFIEKANYCPNCGASMRDGDGSEI